MAAFDRSALRAVALDTIRLIEAGQWKTPRGTLVTVGPDLEASVRGTRVLRGEELLARYAARPEPPAALTTRVEVSGEKTGAAAHRLTRSGERVVLLNFANPVAPGGGFLGGARAQEEELCRASGLYKVLTSGTAAEYYAENRRLAPTLALDHVVLSPSVPFFRDDDYELLDEPYQVVVLTAAAPCLPLLHDEIARGLTDREGLGAIPGLLRQRCAAVVEAAAVAVAEHGCTAVILGAFGCGAFRNDPVVVADAFAAALRRVPLPGVTFACWDPRTPPINPDTFKARFSKWPGPA